MQRLKSEVSILSKCNVGRCVGRACLRRRWLQRWWTSQTGSALEHLSEAAWQLQGLRDPFTACTWYVTLRVGKQNPCPTRWTVPTCPTDGQDRDVLCCDIRAGTGTACAECTQTRSRYSLHLVSLSAVHGCPLPGQRDEASLHSCQQCVCQHSSLCLQEWATSKASCMVLQWGVLTFDSPSCQQASTRTRPAASHQVS